jgi:GxxExxY protein
LAYELRERGFAISRQVGLPVLYREARIDLGYRLDLIVEDLIVIEIKAAERLLPSTKLSCSLI